MVSFALATRVRELRQYIHRAETVEGITVIHEAMVLARSYPHLSAPELLRLAYWGVSGEPSDAR
jgi:hypothetical protein